jgi:hypothetical protein
LADKVGNVKGDVISGNWSGFVTTNLTAGEKFNMTEGEWIIPNAYPNSSKANGMYLAFSWIGIDVLQTGTASQCNVSNGVITSQSAWPWFEWYPAFAVQFSNFSVKSGDTIWAKIYAEISTVGFAFLYNEYQHHL